MTYFIDRLDVSGDVAAAAELRAVLARKLERESAGNRVSCSKRSAVLFWRFGQ